MKRIKFKKPINGFGNAIKLIPESYKVEGNEFEMTDLNETYRIKWVTGKPIIAEAKGGKMDSSDLKRLKDLMVYKPDSKSISEGKASMNDNFNKLLKECKDAKIVEDAEKPMNSSKLLQEDKNALVMLVKTNTGKLNESDIHNFAERRGLNVPEVEEFIYKIAGDKLKK